MKLVRVHVIISGKVHGVFYRASTRDKAVRLGVSGWVKNIYDGRVEAVFCGEKNKVEQMIKWCHKGPSYAKVDNVEITWEEPKGLERFEIRYR